MRTSLRVFSQQVTLVAALFMLTTFHSCIDDDNPVISSIINFNAGSQHVTEGNETIISLTLDKPAPNDGFITIDIATTEVYSQHFTTDPAGNSGSLTLSIVKGQKTAQFTVSTIANTSFDKSKAITFALGTRSFGLQPGATSIFTLTINDDEGPAIANFQTNSGLMQETSDEGIEVVIQLSSAARGQGKIDLFFYSTLGVYGTHFTTSPVATNNLITFDVSQNQTSISFKVLPINNTLYTDSVLVEFSLASRGGPVEPGNNLRYSLTIVDDEKPSIINFATDSATVAENNAEGIIVEIPFSNPVVNPGTIEVILYSPDYYYPGFTYGKDFVTEPAGFGGRMILEVSKNQSSASFKVLPIDNGYSNYYTQVNFRFGIISGDRSLKAGSTTDYILTIIDNEISEAGFAESEVSIAENNASGIQVRINFSKPLAQQTQFLIRGPKEYQDALYGTVYSTIPEMTGDALEECEETDYYYGCTNPIRYTLYQAAVTAQKGATSAEFTVIPIDNVIRGANGVIKFSIFSIDESPLLVTGGEVTLTITEND